MGMDARPRTVDDARVPAPSVPVSALTVTGSLARRFAAVRGRAGGDSEGVTKTAYLRLTQERKRLLVLLATGLGVIPWIAYASLYGDAIDARAYFYAQPGNLYSLPWGEVGAFVYTPAFSQAIEPLRWLGFEHFLTAWRLLETASLALIAGPFTGPLLFVYPVPLEIGTGNVQLILAAAVVLGFRWPAAWSVVLLTKITPGIGLLWFAVRREWRNLGVALGATAAIVAVSFVISPKDWLDWFAFMRAPHNLGAGAFQVITAPLTLRLIASAVLVTWGARTDRRWTVLVAAFLALPSVWLPSVAMLAGLWALRGSRATAAS